MDVLSDVLSAVRLTGAVYFDVRARAPWVAGTPPISTIGARVMPDFEHVMAFHVMMDGRCWAQLADESAPPVELVQGDAVLFVDGQGHVMSSDRGSCGVPNVEMYYRPKDRALPFSVEELGGHGEPARFVCGYLGCDARPFNPILDALPRILHVRAARDGGKLTRELILLALAERERPRAGGESLLARLSELMFIQAVRHYIEGLQPEATGWLAGLRDHHVGAALRLMHGRPAEPWTLESLARETGLSRSVFAERFTHVMGAPAMQYLANWRLQIARRLLEGQRMSIAQAAAAVGYESEAALNRAFRKRIGMPPGAWRRGRSSAR